MEYTFAGWKPYGAGDIFCLDHYVDYGFYGNVLEEVLKIHKLEVLTENTAVVLHCETGNEIARLVREEITCYYGLSWPGHEWPDLYAREQKRWEAICARNDAQAG